VDTLEVKLQSGFVDELCVAVVAQKRFFFGVNFPEVTKQLFDVRKSFGANEALPLPGNGHECVDAGFRVSIQN
jgi:hypothetical protein